MSGEADARRIAAGPAPSEIVRGRAGGSGRSGLSRPLASGQADPAESGIGVPGSVRSGTTGGPDPSTPADSTPAFDPLRLCIFATVALLGWLLGPLALLFFAGLGFAGYWRARRAGLTRSKCLLRDTRLVLAYLGGLAVLAGWGVWRLVAGWLG